ncbi:NAD-dependent epimerase/dehydratase family protein [Haloarchaeobius sp. TZWSO28]|uniref:NAD-dependent epimerase/dehydratase family protein n=1 Tax=Haloarchaeobius sp. TZWSO28 TaxID=3446119 RepID=UPI003EBF7E91
MKVLVTGAFGQCGTAILDHLAARADYEFTCFNRSDRPDDHPYGGYDTIVGDIQEYDKVVDAMDGQDAVVHLAAYPSVESDWSDIDGPNLEGMDNALRAAREARVDSFVFASTNHVMGMYERDHRPDLYELEYGLTIDHESPVRPDSYYGASKAFGEDLGRFFVENHEYPTRFYALRICSVRSQKYDHPYGDAEAGVERGEFERGSEEYAEQVVRMKATWQSRRDLAQQVDCCLQDDTVEFGIFNGVSDNDRRWFDIEHARETLGYDPTDNAEEWDGPPS